ncbi:MAG TPA: asparagine synthase (glutamine-hydrolyzing) [Flavobacteriaceae bacterium]|nr:asparagine synthase (glutamine-hydrolyzing) [Flavobacteriaceae bacterium]
MCGINGIILSKKVDSSSITKMLKTMNQLIIHRGPDDDGFFIDSNDNYSVGMAMRRLSIIDLNTGSQPIYNQDKTITIIFNGEIYNYQNLKNKLIDQGVTFQTKSDTEVILKLYEKYGSESFKELDGMFAFSIFDQVKNKVFIARDFFGEKPLFYSKDKDKFIWASELKSLVNQLEFNPQISKLGLNLFFKLTYTPAPFTIFENIFKLEANHYIEYDLDSHEFEIKPIDTPEKTQKHNISFVEAKSKLHDLVMQSIENRTVSDVPIGTFLSGGVDSSIVSLGVSQLNNKKIDTFSIGFEKASFDETDKSQLVAKLINSNHHEFILSEDDLKNDLNSILLNFDEPFADSSALPTYFVSKKTSDYVKVALTGDGGDEVFGGYNKYYMGKLNEKYTNFVPRKLHETSQNVFKNLLSTKDDHRGKRFKVKKFIDAINYDGESYWNIISLGFSNELSELFLSEFAQTGVFDYYKKKSEIVTPKTLSDFREIDRHISLEGDMLVKVDRTSMQNSLECRAPFLNKKLWQFSNNLPENYLLNNWNKKYILKEAFKHYFPENFLEKSKQGFVVPVGDWLRSSLKPELETYIDKDFLEKQGIFNCNFVIPMVKNHISNKIDKSYQVWAFYVFQKWYCNSYN